MRAMRAIRAMRALPGVVDGAGRESSSSSSGPLSRRNPAASSADGSGARSCLPKDEARQAPHPHCGVGTRRGCARGLRRGGFRGPPRGEKKNEERRRGRRGGEEKESAANGTPQAADDNTHGSSSHASVADSDHTNSVTPVTMPPTIVTTEFQPTVTEGRVQLALEDHRAGVLLSPEGRNQHEGGCKEGQLDARIRRTNQIVHGPSKTEERALARMTPNTA